jgi:GPN-loop GTPase
VVVAFCAHQRRRRPCVFSLAPPPLSHTKQSTYCETIREHCATIGRSVHIVNLGEKGWEGVACAAVFSSFSAALTFSPPKHSLFTDPAAEDCLYPVAFDVRDLITVEDAMEELGLGPNG